MAERIAFIFYLALVLGACGAVGLGVILALALHDPRLLCAGLGASLLAWQLNRIGYRSWNFRHWEESIEPSDRRRVLVLDGSEAPGAEELEEVLEELDVLDGSGGNRDVWRVQELRREANALLEGQPSLRQEFATQLERHPELR